jgi:hypothetical protein
VKTSVGLDAIVVDVEHEHPTDRPRHEGGVRHPIRATVEEVEHAREVVNEGESPATPAIIAGAVIAFVVPLAALIMLLALGIAHFV